MECDVVLLARTKHGLQETEAQLLAHAPGVSVHSIQADLGKLENLESIFSEITQFVDHFKHRQAVLIHNAATLGDITKPIKDHSDPEVVQDYLAVNFTSLYSLTALFLSRFKPSHRCVVVNLTSLLAVNYNYCFGFYSPGKAARNSAMGVLAQENPDVRVLSYSPAVADTDMLKTLGDKSYSSKVTEGVKGLYENEKVLSCRQSVSKLVELLRDDKFENGTMVDYFDEVK